MSLFSRMSLFLFVVLLAAGQGVAAEGFEIVGVGTSPAGAFADGIRNVAGVFGKVQVVSDSEVEDFTLKADHIKAKAAFSGTRLDRFFRGFERRDGLWYAKFYFPADFVQAVQSRPRDAGAVKFLVDWEKISYQSRQTDSFGEVRAESFRFSLPPWYRELIDANVVKTENIGPVAGTMLGVLLLSCILAIAGIAWRDGRKRAGC